MIVRCNTFHSHQRCRQIINLLAIAFSLAGIRMATAQYAPASQPADPDYPRINVSVGYKVDPNWPADPPPADWETVSGVAVDRHDRIWTLNRGRLPVQVYSAQGKFLQAWGEGLFKAGHNLRFDHDGNVWIADALVHTVRKFSPEGKLLLTLGTPDEPGEDDRHFNKPTDIAISPKGDLFVSDGYANNRVVHFDKNGRFIKAWGRLGTKAGEFSLPHSIGIDSKGKLYVGERNNVRIQVFDQQGTSLAQWRNLILPWGIWITPKDEILVCGSSPMRWAAHKMCGLPPKDQIVIKFDTTGRVLELWSLPMSQTDAIEPGQVSWLHSLAADSKGNLYVTDVKGNGVQKFIRLEADNVEK